MRNFTQDWIGAFFTFAIVVCWQSITFRACLNLNLQLGWVINLLFDHFLSTHFDSQNLSFRKSSINQWRRGSPCSICQLLCVLFVFLSPCTICKLPCVLPILHWLPYLMDFQKAWLDCAQRYWKHIFHLSSLIVFRYLTSPTWSSLLHKIAQKIQQVTLSTGQCHQSTK